VPLLALAPQQVASAGATIDGKRMSARGRGPVESVAPTRRARGRHRTVRPLTPGRLRGIAGETLVRNAASLIFNLLLGAACGYGGLGLMARLYSVRAVGLSATAASLGALVVSMTQLGANYSLPRYLPVSRRPAEVINTALTASIAAALLGAAIVLLLPVSSKFAALGPLFAGAFILATVVQSAEALMGTVLIAERSATTLAKANIGPNLVKLAGPAIFAFAGSFGAYVARFASDVVAFLTLGVIVRRRGHRFRPMFDRISVRELRRFSVGMYVAGIIGGLPLMALPVIVLTRFGPTGAAYWSVGITMAMLLYQLPTMVGQALLPEVVHRRTERQYLLRRSAVLTGAIVAPVLLVAYFAAPFGLAILGPRYVAGSLPLLRWLIISGFVTILNYPAGIVLALAKKTLAISLVNVINAVIVLGLAVSWARDPEGVAISWLIGDVANTALFCGFAIMVLRRVRGNWAAVGGDAVQPADVLLPVATLESQAMGLQVLFELARSQEGPVGGGVGGGSRLRDGPRHGDPSRAGHGVPPSGVRSRPRPLSRRRRDVE
jgi:O-antigen/teichoic acid export membrane protein